MEMSGARRPPAARSSIVALALACAVWAQPATAMSNRGDGSLSPRLAELAKPAVRTLSPAKQAARLSIASEGPGSLLREGDRVLVDVRFDQGAIAELDALRAAGARIVAASSRYQTVTVAVAPASLHTLTGVAGVEGVSENRAPLLYGVGESPSTAAVGATCEGGAVVSEGVAQLHVGEARSKYNVNGSGVTVGVLSDSYDKATTAATGSGPIATHASEDVASGDLPGVTNACSGQETPVKVLEDSASSSSDDEGRAMLQTVHDVAPNASLAFATAFKSELSFAENIEKLAKPVAQGGAGAKVIADDVVYFDEPFFQDGPIANAVNKVAGEGVTYFSAAGNNNLFDASKHEIASWEAPEYRDTDCPSAVNALLEKTETHCMNFSSGTDNTFGLTVEPKRTLTVDLQWAEPWSGVHADLDAYLLDSGGKLLAEEDTNNVLVDGKPVEVLQWENTSSEPRNVQMVINRCFSTCNPGASPIAKPRLKFALLENGRGVTATEYPSSSGEDVVGPTIFGHTGATGAVSVAAVPYSNSGEPERYSSRGPVTHYFGPVGITAALPLPSAEAIPKPDIAATDCGATTFFARLVAGAWRFCGTSAAAPHAAGIAALELQAKPSASLAEIRSAQTSTASAIPGFGSNAVGAGLLDASGAVASLLPPPVVTITEHPSSRTADSTPTFKFEANQPATFTCSIDGATPQTCSSPYTPKSSLSDGAHTFDVNAVDGSQNVLGTASFSFTVDTTPPTIAFAKQPAVTADATPTLAFSASEPAGFTCSVDGALPNACSSPYAVVAPLADGPHTLQVTGTDQVGNVGHGSVEFTVDTVAPSVTFTSRPPESTNDKTPTFAFISSESATYTCALDDFLPQPCDSPFTTPIPLADGPHTFEVVATDQVGNAGRASDAFAVDIRRPNTFFAGRPRRVIRTRSQKARATFRFGSNETGVTFICKVDGGLLRFCGSTLSRRFDPGKHFVLVKARDAAGNVDRTPAVFHFKVK
jgi:hypothetical protein